MISSHLKNKIAIIAATIILGSFSAYAQKGKVENLKVQKNQFTVNGKKISLSDLVLKLQLNRSKALDKQLLSQANAIKQKNEKIESANNTLQNLQAQQAGQTGADKAKTQAQINQTKAEIDQLSSSSQLDMIRLQTLINKRNQSLSIISNTIKKQNDAKKNIIQNTR